MENLSRIFGSRVRVKIMRLFLLNPDKAYDASEIKNISKGRNKEITAELAALEKAGLIKKKIFFRDAAIPRNKGPKEKIKISGWVLNQSFRYLDQLRGLLVNTILIRNQDLLKRLSNAANLKLVAVAGIFILNWDSRIDLLIIAEKIRKGILERKIRSIESELGKELRYTLMDTADFQYRLSVGDKLVRDIFDYPHELILDKIGLKKSANKNTAEKEVTLSP